MIASVGLLSILIYTALTVCGAGVISLVGLFVYDFYKGKLW